MLVFEQFSLFMTVRKYIPVLNCLHIKYMPTKVFAFFIQNMPEYAIISSFFDKNEQNFQRMLLLCQPNIACRKCDKLKMNLLLLI